MHVLRVSSIFSCFLSLVALGCTQSVFMLSMCRTEVFLLGNSSAQCDFSVDL